MTIINFRECQSQNSYQNVISSFIFRLRIFPYLKNEPRSFHTFSFKVCCKKFQLLTYKNYFDVSPELLQLHIFLFTQCRKKCAFRETLKLCVFILLSVEK